MSGGEGMKRTIQTFFTALLCTTVLFFYAFPRCQAAEEKKNDGDVIRVGYPLQDGLTMKDKDGNYSGYTYDYLREISQYTGWKYEFVEVKGDINTQITKLDDMLKKGEIDILGAMSSNEQTQKMYDFATENYGNAYSVIAVHQKEARIDEYNLAETKDFTIALLRQAGNRNEQFYQYARLNGVDYKTVWASSTAEQVELVESGKADALLSVDLALPTEYRAIAKFSPLPFYFATTKGNTKIMNELNQAMTYINEADPMLQNNLYNTYFARNETQLLLNSQEKAYMKAHPKLRVLAFDGAAPLQYFDSQHKIQGVSKDLLEGISKKVGGKIEYVYVDSIEEYEKAISNKSVDLLLTVSYDYDPEMQQDILVSNSYLTSEIVMVARKGVNVSELSGKREAACRGNPVKRSATNVQKRVYYDTYEACLEAVEHGEADYTYVSSYVASYYQNKNGQEKTVFYPQGSSQEISYSFGILNKDDKRVASILNKGIRATNATELEGYIYAHAQQKLTMSWQDFIKDNPLPFVFGIGGVAVILLLMGYAYYRSQMKMKRQLELENTRYNYLSDILKEVTFTYDYDQDVLTLSKEGRRIFGTEEKIYEYSLYHSHIFIDSSRPTLYALLKEGKNADCEILMQAPNQPPQWYLIVLRVIFDNGHHVSAIGRIQNIHAEKLEREQLVESSRRDGMTQVYNAATLKLEISHWLLDTSKVMALGVIDMDNFKDVNDQHGHYTGDQVLIQLAQALQEVFSDHAIVGRLGGDEFIICCEYRNRQYMEHQCHELFHNLHERTQQTGLPIPTISVGISLSKPFDDYVSLYQRADSILYDVKNSGKNNFKIE